MTEDQKRLAAMSPGNRSGWLHAGVRNEQESLQLLRDADRAAGYEEGERAGRIAELRWAVGFLARTETRHRAAELDGPSPREAAMADAVLVATTVFRARLAELEAGEG